MSEFVNGIVTPSEGLSLPMTKTEMVTFTPEQIYTETETVGDKVQPKVTTKATGIAAYLTEIANNIPEAKRDFFLKFINEGRLVACSSTNVQKLKEWVESWAASEQLSITLPAIPNDIAGYPADILLPDGAAAVKWNNTEGKFEPQPVTTTEANINRLDRFIYPIELWYYANSRIKTSTESKRDFFSRKNWADVLREYETDNGVMHAGVHSVVIKDPLSYAVGCMRIGLTAASTLEDADGNTITLGDATFPLTATLVSGQYKQAFNFTPMNDVSEYIVYDNQMEEVSLGAARTATPSTATPARWSHTLVLQSKDGASVRFALEFKNTTGYTRHCQQGDILPQCKFYLVGKLEAPVGGSVFTQDHKTTVSVKIESLRSAYNTIPDLHDPQLEIGIVTEMKWNQINPQSIILDF
jgi:hypothetical protein